MELPRLLPTTKSWLARNVSSSEPNHRTALERVRAGQCPVPLAAAEATQRRHKTGIASSPGPFGGRSRSCIARSTALRLRLQHLTAIPEPGRRCRQPLAAAGQNTNPGSINQTSRILRRAMPGSTSYRGGQTYPSAINWSLRLLRDRKTRATAPQERRTPRQKRYIAPPPRLPHESAFRRFTHIVPKAVVRC